MKDSIRVTFLGPAASFSHQAAIDSFGKDDSVSLFPSVSFAEAFSAIQNNDADYAVIPIENSTNGSVVQTLDLLADRQGSNEDVIVCADYFLTVQHCLIVGARPVNKHKEDSFNSINKLYTHPQAWGQCEKFLSQHFRGIERQDVSSTSKAVEIVAKETSGREAAIASKLAAEHHGAFVLQEHIEDRADNTTRFLVLRNRLSKQSSNITSFLKTGSDTDEPKKKRKSLISFMIEHSAPGALADALAVFKKHGLNLTSINSRPSLIRPWQYIFFVECEHVPTANDETCISDILKELGTICHACRSIGSWIDGRDLIA
ncbi:chorismate mutase/prephenate dehydratase [Talaromyces stipitatus ATCC 10500]|uniref:prephenate dehydratase n=1 Tax=Talaromyces stipitatus (strain ATCC 10500 / CBS 375.48 / QM 6759 / NRRL 1006) TaxID=441959 RepID=B8MBZ7_TALSN|nr:chorismate mutase/prephenate dehydratase [Talaromyces stipitatus ATCC 10500]EED18443.1 chorismate mutase/prephenate dehydratase [Talaromyces stipitatus ATCC 10500]